MQSGLLDEIKELNRYNFAQQSKKQTSAPDQADLFCIFEAPLEAQASPTNAVNGDEPQQLNTPVNENPDNV